MDVQQHQDYLRNIGFMICQTAGHWHVVKKCQFQSCETLMENNMAYPPEYDVILSGLLEIYESCQR